MRSGPEAQTVVEVRSLRAVYGERVVLEGVDVEARRGEIHVVLGGSGCGKSTLMRHMIGLAEPASGSVRLLGSELGGLDEDARRGLLRRIGVLFQGGGLFHSMSVGDNVAFPLREHTELPEEVIEALVRQKLALVGLTDASRLLPAELSGGMKKRAGLARALALEPELLFFDEPSAGLDPVTSAALDELMVELRDRLGVTLVVVTHELASIDRIADRVTFLAHGKALASGPLAELRQSELPEVADFFGRSTARNEAAEGPWPWTIVP
jgi:phospholipid/cholesterol/gamma-HCH transport system ATP-binding protein